MRPYGPVGMMSTGLSLAAFYGHPEGSCGLMLEQRRHDAA